MPVNSVAIEHSVQGGVVENKPGDTAVGILVGFRTILQHTCSAAHCVLSDIGLIGFLLEEFVGVKPLNYFEVLRFGFTVQLGAKWVNRSFEFNLSSLNV